MHYIIGVDEVGRGPIAGPVAVGAVVVAEEAMPELAERCEGFRDSKKLSEKKREEWSSRIKEYADQGLLRYTVSLIDAHYIDRAGIVPAIGHAASECLKSFKLDPNKCQVLLDRGITAPEEYADQKDIIKGDETELVIALASIVAKVTRDRRMVEYASEYPNYGFEQHKGYGTSKHYEAVKNHGLTPIHRRSFMGRK